MLSQIFLVVLISASGICAEKATSYVSVSKGKEGGYSYEVIHDFPKKGGHSSLHSFSDAEDYGDRPPDVSYDYEIRHTPGSPSSGEVPSSHPPHPGPSSSPQTATKESAEYDENYSSQINGDKNFGVFKHTATAPGGSHSVTRAGGQSYSSTFVNDKPNTRPNKGVGSRRKPKIPAQYVQSTSAPSHSNGGFKESIVNPSDYGNSVSDYDYKGESVGDYGVKESHGLHEYTNGGFSPSNDFGYKQPTSISYHSYEEPTKITDYDYKGHTPVSDYNYNGPTVSGYDRKGPTPLNVQGYQGLSPASNQGHNGPKPVSDQGYSGPTPVGNLDYNGPTPVSNQGYNGPSPVIYNDGGRPTNSPAGNSGATVFSDHGFRVSWTTDTGGTKAPLKSNQRPNIATKNYHANTKPGLDDTNIGTGIHASASGPGATFSHPVVPSPADHGPIIYHNHHYTGQNIDESFFDFPNNNVRTPNAKLKSNDQIHLTKPTHGLKTTFGHTCSSNDVGPVPAPSKYPDFDYSKFPEFKDFNQPTNSAKFPAEQSEHSSSLNANANEFYSKFFGKSHHTRGKKGKWKPVIITSSKNKGKLYTFRISKDFKPGKLLGDFKPSFGPSGHQKAAAHQKYTGESQSNYAEHSGQEDPFAHFKDAPYFDYDSLVSSLGSYYGDHQKDDDVDTKSNFGEFSDYDSSEKKSLKDYHNSLTDYGSKATGYRQSKGPKLSAAPIVVPPLRTTTFHSSTTITSPVPVDVTSFVDVPSPLAVHSLHSVSGRNVRHPAKHSNNGNPASDQATSYANSQNLSSSGRLSKRKTSQNKT